MTHTENNPIIHQVRRLIAYYQSMGIHSYPRSPALENLLAGGTSTENRPLSARKSTPDKNKHAVETLEGIRADLGDCRRCPLHTTRTNIVFGSGKPSADLLIICDGPGQEDDLTGQLFSDESGALLSRMLAAISLKLEDVYLAGLVKCLPQGNRNPDSAEIHSCRPFLDRQIAAIRPKIICIMGTEAARTFLGGKDSISQLRGRFHQLPNGTGQKNVMVTYHPALLLQNEELKKASWADLQTMQKKL